METSYQLNNNEVKQNVYDFLLFLFDYSARALFLKSVFPRDLNKRLNLTGSIETPSCP